MLLEALPGYRLCCHSSLWYTFLVMNETGAAQWVKLPAVKRKVFMFTGSFRMSKCKYFHLKMTPWLTVACVPCYAKNLQSLQLWDPRSLGRTLGGTGAVSLPAIHRVMRDCGLGLDATRSMLLMIAALPSMLSTRSTGKDSKSLDFSVVRLSCPFFFILVFPLSYRLYLKEL